MSKIKTLQRVLDEYKENSEYVTTIILSNKEYNEYIAELQNTSNIPKNEVLESFPHYFDGRHITVMRISSPVHLANAHGLLKFVNLQARKEQYEKSI